MGDAGTGYGGMHLDGYPRSSLPWQERERHPSSLDALLKTIRVVLMAPSNAFTAIQVEGSLGSSMLYVVLLGTAGTLGALLWKVLLHAGIFLPVARRVPEILAAYVGGMGILFAILAVLTPLMALIGSLVGAFVLHACLWLVGGASQSFEATYAVVAYANGSTALLNLVPFCGSTIAPIWALVIQVIGLARVHDCGAGRALLAVLLPTIICCASVAALLVFIFSFVVLGATP